MTKNIEKAILILKSRQIFAKDFTDDADKAVVICEAIGLLAKRNEERGDSEGAKELYCLRTKCIIECLSIKGVCASVGVDLEGNNVFYIDTPNVGTASFHDVSNVLAAHIKDEHVRDWSGIPRQDLAFLTLAYPELRNLLNEEIPYTDHGEICSTAKESLEKRINDFYRTKKAGNDDPESCLHLV